MRKLDKKARKGRKAAKAKKEGRARVRPVLSYDELCGLWKAPGAVIWSPASLAVDCAVRLSGAAAWFMRDVYCAHYREHHVHLEIDRMQDPGEETARRLVLERYSHSLFAFPGEGDAPPELADAVRDAVRHALGLRGRPGIAVSIVYGWLAEHLPENRAAPFRNVDWEALAGQITEQALAEAKPAFVNACASLRDLTSR